MNKKEPMSDIELDEYGDRLDALVKFLEKEKEELRKNIDKIDGLIHRKETETIELRVKGNKLRERLRLMDRTQETFKKMLERLVE